jgi:hypothetical protein
MREIRWITRVITKFHTGDTQEYFDNYEVRRLGLKRWVLLLLRTSTDSTGLSRSVTSHLPVLQCVITRSFSFLEAAFRIAAAPSAQIAQFAATSSTSICSAATTKASITLCLDDPDASAAFWVTPVSCLAASLMLTAVDRPQSCSRRKGQE